MTKTQRATDTQIGGDHYRSMAIQPSEFIQRNGLNWCEGNVIKYLARHRNKNGAQDILKAIHYCQLLLEWEYPGHGKTAAGCAPLSPSDVKEIAESVEPPSLCVSCVRGCDDKGKEYMRECLGYLTPPPSDGWETKDLCRRCGDVTCGSAGTEQCIEKCHYFFAKITDAAPAPLSLSSAKFSYNFPAAEKFMGAPMPEYIGKLREEVEEVREATNPRDRVIELMDVIHAAETAIRSVAAYHGLNVEELAAATYQKNLDRGYYSR